MMKITKSRQKSKRRKIAKKHLNHRKLMNKHKVHKEISMYKEAEEFDLKIKQRKESGFSSAGLKALEDIRGKAYENFTERKQHLYFHQQLQNGKGS